MTVKGSVKRKKFKVMINLSANHLTQAGREHCHNRTTRYDSGGSIWESVETPLAGVLKCKGH